MSILQLSKEEIEEIVLECHERFLVVDFGAIHKDALGESMELYVLDHQTGKYYSLDVYQRGYMNLVCSLSTTLFEVEKENRTLEVTTWKKV